MACDQDFNSPGKGLIFRPGATVNTTADTLPAYGGQHQEKNLHFRCCFEGQTL
jgi:hypothetical protein